MKTIKHLFLSLLLASFCLNAQTRSEIQTEIETIQTGVPNTALKIRNVLGVLADGVAQTGDIKEIDVSNAYLAANFDATGLGINERVGWAICNGNNGTRNRLGRVGMQYSTSYPTLGATGGSADAVVVEHTHATTPNTNLNFGTGDSVSRSRAGVVSGGIGDPINVTIGNTGESGVGKNLQPYIVTLFIMKLP